MKNRNPKYARRKSPVLHRNVKQKKISKSTEGNILIRVSKIMVRTCLFLIILGGLGFVITGAYKYYSKSDLFIFKDVMVLGNVQLSKKDVITYLNVEYGIKILEVPVDHYENMLSQHPLIESVSIGRRYPSKIKIKIKEKEAVALILYRDKKNKNHWMGLGTTGIILPRFNPQKSSLPVLEWKGLKKDKSLKNLADFLTYSQIKYPEIFNSISQIKYMKKNQFSIYSRNNKHQLIVSTELKPESTLSFWKMLWKKYEKDFEKDKVIDLRVRGCAYVS